METVAFAAWTRAPLNERSPSEACDLPLGWLWTKITAIALWQRVSALILWARGGLPMVPDSRGLMTCLARDHDKPCAYAFIGFDPYA